MDTIFCQYCGTPNSIDARFCKSCGKPINVAPAPQQPLYPQQPVYSQPPQQQVYQPYMQQPNIPLQPIAIVEPPKKKHTGRTIILGLLLGIVGLCVAIFGYVLLFTAPIQKTANAFLTAMQNQDFSTAYSMLAPDVQNQLGSPDNLKTALTSNGWAYKSYKGTSVKRIPGNPPQGVVLADLTLLDGSTYTLEVDLQTGAGSVWQIIGFGPPAQ
jgi:hypothetical protein